MPRHILDWMTEPMEIRRLIRFAARRGAADAIVILDTDSRRLPARDGRRIPRASEKQVARLINPTLANKKGPDVSGPVVFLILDWISSASAVLPVAVRRSDASAWAGAAGLGTKHHQRQRYRHAPMPYRLCPGHQEAAG
jgi:hypothetical protein